MTGKIEITHPDGAVALEGLKTFLVRDPETRRMGRVRWENAKPESGTLGGGLDVLAIVISGTLALPGFIQVVSNWFKSRGSNSPGGAEIRLGSASIMVSGTEDPTEIRRLADVLKAAYPEPPSEPGGQ
ncbi:hypothetical protein AB0A76_21355 [Streptomyces exfoliatus]|uniref:Uncharacterized protein n=1 Tax=Streptomyces exfoliatus TaxID=1905 RepID=A0ABV3CZU4_STREX